MGLVTGGGTVTSPATPALAARLGFPACKARNVSASSPAPNPGDITLPFPPNYSQERSNRARSKARKALDKQQKRDDKSDQRKSERVSPIDKPEAQPPGEEQK